MIGDRTVAVVVPAYNEESQISMVIDTMPDFVDRIIIVDDYSSDKTSEIVKRHIENNGKEKILLNKNENNIVQTKHNQADIMLEKLKSEAEKYYTPSQIYNDNNSDYIVLIRHLRNGGVGAAIATGYKWCRDRGIDCTAVMAGDGQMDPDELYDLCIPVISEKVDYVKGNRLIHKSSSYIIPKARFIGNSILSILTKIASGYWNISDTQTGYTTISKDALNSIDIHKIYKSYGMPNDLLVKLNMAYCTIKELPIKPIYNIGEKSKMKIFKVIPKISWLLLKLFLKRIWYKYFLKDFHPLFLFYSFGIILAIFNFPITIQVFVNLLKHSPISVGTYIGFIFLFISSFQSIAFGMWMDIHDNQRLYK